MNPKKKNPGGLGKKKMKVYELDIVLKEALATHEMFRKLGFLPSEIFIIINESIGVAVKAQGKETSVRIGEASRLFDEMMSLWKESVHAWNNEFTDSERNEIWENSLARKNATWVCGAMLALGFKFPGSIMDKVNTNPIKGPAN